MVCPEQDTRNKRPELERHPRLVARPPPQAASGGSPRWLPGPRLKMRRFSSVRTASRELPQNAGQISAGAVIRHATFDARQGVSF